VRSYQTKPTTITAPRISVEPAIQLTGDDRRSR
jgi:hypothetical protein